MSEARRDNRRPRQPDLVDMAEINLYLLSPLRLGSERRRMSTELALTEGDDFQEAMAQIIRFHYPENMQTARVCAARICAEMRGEPVEKRDVNTLFLNLDAVRGEAYAEGFWAGKYDTPERRGERR